MLLVLPGFTGCKKRDALNQCVPAVRQVVEGVKFAPHVKVYSTAIVRTFCVPLDEPRTHLPSIAQVQGF